MISSARVLAKMFKIIFSGLHPNMADGMRDHQQDKKQ
jgi:hypothetical protein